MRVILQKNLQPNEVFLEYVTTDSFIYVLAISKDAVKSQFKILDEPLSYLVKKLQYLIFIFNLGIPLNPWEQPPLPQ